MIDLGAVGESSFRSRVRGKYIRGKGSVEIEDTTEPQTKDNSTLQKTLGLIDQRSDPYTPYTDLLSTITFLDGLQYSTQFAALLLLYISQSFDRPNLRSRILLVLFDSINSSYTSHPTIKMVGVPHSTGCSLCRERRIKVCMPSTAPLHLL